MICIVSHDAGGAEILSSWGLRSREPYCLVLDGPAVGIFKRKLGHCDLLSLNKAVEQSDWLLCGTSWASGLERNAIKTARLAGKKTVAFLDHWVNYHERFQGDGVCCYPDEIWVGDQYAYDLAENIFSDVPILLQSNPYVEDLQKRFKDEQLTSNARALDGSTVLYLCEPIKEHAFLQHGNERYWGYTEDDAISYFFDHIKLLGIEAPKVRIRLHPSEQAGKYDWVLRNSENYVTKSEEPDLAKDILRSDVVVGCTSMAMYIALLAEKRVVSVIPSEGVTCSIPFKEIEHMQALVSKSRMMD